MVRYRGVYCTRIIFLVCEHLSKLFIKIGSQSFFNLTSKKTGFSWKSFPAPLTGFGPDQNPTMWGGLSKKFMSLVRSCISELWLNDKGRAHISRFKLEEAFIGCVSAKNQKKSSCVSKYSLSPSSGLVMEK